MTRMVRTTSTRLAVLGALTTGVAGLVTVGCGQSEPGDPTSSTVAVAAATPAASIPGTSVLGFEVTAGWKVSSGTVALSTGAHTQGAAALAVTAPQNYTTLLSVPLASGLAPLAGLTNSGATVLLDLQLPTSQPSLSYLGAVQLYISVPSRGVNNQYLGQTELTGRQLGTFQTYSFAVTSFVQSKLAGATYSDLTFTVALNAPAGAKGTYLFDNLRTTSPATAPVGSGPSVDLLASVTQSPLANTPGTASFTLGTIQIPGSFHVKVGSAGTGTALLELGFGSTPSFSCTYAASSDKTAYVFSSCTTQNVAGDIVSASFARLTLKATDPTAPLTKVKAQLAYNVLGDQVGTKLVPPIPTFWGTSLTEINTISQAFTQLQLASLPSTQRFVNLPVPDFAQRQGDGTPVNALTGATPRPVGDPPFDFKGDLNNSATGGPSGMFDGYYEVAGNLSGGQVGQNFTSHFQATGTAGVVVLSVPVDVLSVTVTVDTDNGGTTPYGSTNPTSTGTVSGSVLGFNLPTETGTVQSGFNFNDTLTKSYDTPPIPIWIFSIQGGVTASAGIVVNGALAINGAQLTATPQASVGAHVEGGVNIGVASGGVNVTIQLISVQIPVVASMLVSVSTDPAICAASVTGNVNGSVQVTSGGGSVDLEATLGPCPFCVSDSWNIFRWKGFSLGTVPFPQPFPVTLSVPVGFPSSFCNLPLLVTITKPTTSTPVYAGIGSPTTASANQTPRAGQFLGAPVDCQYLKWTSSDPSATYSPSATGCSPLVTFSAAAGGTTQTLTATATDQYGQTGSASVNVNVQATPTGPIPSILTPVDQEVSSGGAYSLTGVVSGGSGTVTATWTFDGVPVGTPQSFPAGANITLTPVSSGDDGGDGFHTFVLTVTDSAGSTPGVASVTVETEIVR